MTTGLVQSSAGGIAQQPQRGASPSPDEIRLGDIAPRSDAIDAVVAQHRAFVHQLGEKLYPHPQHRREYLTLHDVLSFDHYQQAIGLADRHKQTLLEDSRKLVGEPTPALVGFLKRYNPKRHTANVEGWVQYLSDLNAALAPLIAELGAVKLPDAARKMHTLITAKSGWGKTELLKALVHHNVVHETAAVVVLDPHGSMAKQIAMWPELQGSDRLVYIQPDLIPGYTVGLNPLDPTGLNQDDIEAYAEQLGVAIGEMSKDLTQNMLTVSQGCAQLLLEDGHATLFDLLDLMERPPKAKEPPTPASENRARLIAKGRQHPRQIIERFFTGRLQSDSFHSAREGIDNRVTGLLLRRTFEEMTCGPSTIQLRDLIDQRKVIVFNLAPLGKAGRAAMGRLVVAMATAIALRREAIPEERRVPCHLFVDEAQTMASPSMEDILFECRKFGIHLTLSQQVEGVNFSEAGQQALAHGTGIRIAGANLRALLKGVFGDVAPPKGEEVDEHEFWVRWVKGEPFRLRVRNELVAKSPDPESPAWKALQASQKKYYRPAAERMSKPPKSAAEAPRTPAPAPASVPVTGRLAGLELPFE